MKATPVSRQSGCGIDIPACIAILTDFDAVFGEECTVFSEVDTAADDIACVENRAKRPAIFLTVKATAVIAVVAPRLGLPAHWS